MEPNQNIAEEKMQVPPPPAKEHAHPPAAGKTAAEYAYDAMNMHQKALKGDAPPALLKWMGDAQLAVLPRNRLYCAIGLTAGLMTAGSLAKIATGFDLTNKAVAREEVPTFLRWMHKIVKNYDPKALDVSRNRWIRYAQFAAYSLGGLAGIKLGTDYTYAGVHKKNKDPKNLEDYLARVSMHQGDTWAWLAAASGIFGSSSGLFALPVPGLNYAMGLAGRTTSMQDRNIMLKGMNDYISGATTTSYLRLREGMHYMCHHVVGNPAENPTQIEFLAYTLLGPIFKDELTAEHIEKFTAAVHKVRDKYWQEGGIPKDKRKDAVKEMKEVFTGAGLEVLLIDMGLNPGAIQFDKLNGAIGKIGNLSSAAINAIHADQEAYTKGLKDRLPKYVADGKITQERADWVIEGIEARKAGKPIPPLAPARSLGTPSSEILLADTTLTQETPKEAKTEFAKATSTDMGAASRPNSINELIESAGKPGDWRATTLKQKQSFKSPAMVVE
ncbi:MAG: hypothetical protein EBR02_05925 [Alphaproteobacteria bacterium]|nr:hypothetical protein [Alphaproteobacteria bacterium]